MLRNSLPIILHPLFTKISSIFIGYMLWFFVAQHQDVSRQLTLPVCFFNNDSMSIIAPTQATITITGSRSDVSIFNPSENAIHVDTSNYQPGKHNLQLSRENLFLPDSLKLVQLIPSNISINIDTEEQKK